MATPIPTLTATPTPTREPTDTYVVDSTDDTSDADLTDGLCEDGAGACTLRAAIEQANATAGVQTIHFAISGDAPHVIQVLSPLPVVEETLDIDGTTAPGYAGQPVVTLDGRTAGEDASGLVVTADKVSVRGLHITNFDYAGIILRGGAGHLVEANLVVGNRTIGILAQDARDSVIRENVVAESEVGVYLYGAGSTGNTVEANLIGTDVSGTNARPNEIGVRITNAASNRVGGSLAGAGNVIVSTDVDVYLAGVGAVGNQIHGNRLGIGTNGNVLLGAEVGVYINGVPGNQIGDIKADGGNRIMAEVGVYIRGAAASRNLVQGNDIGLADGVRALAGLPEVGVRIHDAADNLIGGRGGDNRITAQGAGVRVTGHDAATNRVEENDVEVSPDADALSREHATASLLSATDPHARLLPLGLSVEKQSATRPLLQSLTFTVTSTGDTKDANVGDGVCDDGSGACTLRAALQEANALPGIDRIHFNIPGTGPHTIQPASKLPALKEAVIIDARTEPDYAGLPVVELNGISAGAGVDGLTLDASGIEIYGLAINRFDDNAIEIDPGASGAVIQANYLGVDPTGTAALGNLGNGIEIDEASNLVIGGTDAGAGNVISGNGSDGIEIDDPTSTNNVIQGNYIGTDVTGTLDLGNGAQGVYLFGTASDNTIGGSAAGAGNVISGNDGSGVRLSDVTRTVIQDNLIGTTADGTSPLGNATNGIILTSGASNNLIGGVNPGEANNIAFNGDDGVDVDHPGTGNAIRGNRIYDNTALGIDLGSSGVTANDTGDADTGANNLQNYPVLESAFSDGASTIVAGTLNSTADTPFTLDFYASASCDASGHGEGATYLGAAEVTTDANGNAGFSANVPVAVAEGQVVTATATDPGGNTSEFSACVTATATIATPDAYDWHYTYDGLGRLTSACSQWDAATETCTGDAFSYSYDGAGNLLTLSRWDAASGQVETVSYLYNNANQIRCVDADLSGACDAAETLWQYDAYGNLLDDGVETYTYDAALRLVSVSDGANTTTYAYNGDGDRVSQAVDGVTTTYLLDIATPLTMVLAEQTGSETIAYLHGLDLVAQSDGVTTEYFAYDGLGSVRQVVDEAGSPLLTQTFDPYGSVYAQAGIAETAWGFTGEYVGTNGLLYLRARYYATSQGRFFQLDPSRVEVNLYGYTAGNPINFVDPSGLSRRLPPCYGPEWYCGLLAALGLTAPVEAPTTTPIRPGDGDWLSPETYPNPFGAPYSPSLPTMTPLKWCGIAGLLLYVSTMCGSTPLGCQSEAQSVPEPLPAPRPDSPPEPVPPPLPRSDNQDTAYRNPAPSEHPRALIEGFFAKNPSASYSPAFHVARGSAYSTQFISLTRSIEVARNWQQPDLPIYIIDLNKVVGTVYDFTVERVLQEWITHPRTQNMARASQEILVEGWIPPQAILGTVP